MSSGLQRVCRMWWARWYARHVRLSCYLEPSLVNNSGHQRLTCHLIANAGHSQSGLQTAAKPYMPVLDAISMLYTDLAAELQQSVTIPGVMAEHLHLPSDASCMCRTSASDWTASSRCSSWASRGAASPACSEPSVGCGCKAAAPSPCQGIRTSSSCLRSPSCQLDRCVISCCSPQVLP